MRRLLATALLLGAVFAARIASAAPGGTVTLECPVFGAAVAIDGKEVGLVPLDPFPVAAGKRVLTVKRRGLIDFREQLTVTAGAKLEVRAAPPKAMALLTIQSPVRGAEVLVDGKVVGNMPTFELPIEPGKHRLFVRGPGLQPFQETFLIGPHREYVSKPTLRNTDGTPAGSATIAGGGLELDLDLDAGAAPATAKPAGRENDALAMDLDLDGDDLPPLPEIDDVPARPVVAANTPAKPAVAAAPPVKPAVAAAPPAKPATPAKPAVAAAPPVKQPPAIAARTTPSEPVAAFAADPVAAEQVRAEKEPSKPLYKQKWVWAATAAVVVAAVAVPVATGRTGGYREVRDPTTACGDCLVVMNR